MANDIRQLQLRLEESFFPRHYLARILLASAFLTTLLCRSTKLISLFPILVDEAIYMRWGEIIQHQHEWFVSLLDAKPPLLFWLIASLRLVIEDPLLASRAISVCAGCVTMLVLYRIGFLCGGVRCGVVLASVDALLPFGLLYDRVGYADAVVNLLGACLGYASLSAFGVPSLPWVKVGIVDLTLGVGLFVKTTIVLYAACPAVIGVYLHQRASWKLGTRLLVLYALAGVFPLWSHLAIPEGPTPRLNNTFLHHATFFTSVQELIRAPWTNAVCNLPLLKAYFSTYVGIVAIVIATVAVVVLLINQSYLPLLIAVASTGPLLTVALALTYFPSRYVFPMAWPMLLLIARGTTSPRFGSKCRMLGSVCFCTVLLSMLKRDMGLLSAPEQYLFRDDAEEFFGDGAYSGSGVREAAAFIKGEARGHGAIVLADPWWGPPTDAAFSYLNQREGIEVYEAWWLETRTKSRLVPEGLMPVWRSQYQRVLNGAVDFSKASPLYYVTDTSYREPYEVRLLDSNAVLERRFAKRRPGHFIDVYRLR